LGRYGSFSSSSNGALNLTTVMVNGYYDIPLTNSGGSRSRWSPYIGAGIGYANINAPSCSGSGCFSGGSTGGFAYQGNVGLSYGVGNRSQAFVETGYLGSTGGSIDRVNFNSFSSWRVFLGWRQGFGRASEAQSASAPQADPTSAQESQ
jgi:opacity protein-like surface antigen